MTGCNACEDKKYWIAGSDMRNIMTLFKFNEKTIKHVHNKILTSDVNVPCFVCNRVGIYDGDFNSEFWVPNNDDNYEPVRNSLRNFSGGDTVRTRLTFQ